VTLPGRREGGGASGGRGLLALGAACAALAWDARRPPRHPLGALPGFAGGVLSAELPMHHAAAGLAATGLLVRRGALSERSGWLGLGLAAASAGVFSEVAWTGLGARRTMQAALDEVAGALGAPAPLVAPGAPLLRLLLGIPVPVRGVERRRGLVFAADPVRLRLDLYRPTPLPGRAPAVVYLHGGGWATGSRHEQGLPLLWGLAARGFVVASADYRLSPRATWPDHLVDVKRAIAYVRDHAEELGVDPSFVAVAGGSAGGHLAAMAALTADVDRYQPGFERADTSVQACIPLYGVYDFTNRKGYGHPAMVPFLERVVMKKRLSEDREAFEAASPLSLVHEGAPPFLVVHGTNDTLAPVAEARLFVETLRAASRAPVAYAELRGAHHAFDLVVSPRSLAVVDGVAAFLELARHHARLAASLAKA
jgi:acetyl esterase/lipase